MEYTTTTEVRKKMNNWKTTLTAIVGAIAAIVAAFGIQVSTEVQIAIVTLTMFLIGIFAGDAKNNTNRRS